MANAQWLNERGSWGSGAKCPGCRKPNSLFCDHTWLCFFLPHTERDTGGKLLVIKSDRNTTKELQYWQAVWGFLVNKEVKQHSSVFLVQDFISDLVCAGSLHTGCSVDTVGSPGVYPGWGFELIFASTRLPCIPDITASLGENEKHHILMHI